MNGDRDNGGVEQSGRNAMPVGVGIGAKGDRN
jgi:hypothetical protein